MKLNNSVKTYLSEIGKKGGMAKSPKKTLANLANAKIRWAGHKKISKIKELKYVSI
jgi:hypothetical protein